MANYSIYDPKAIKSSSSLYKVGSSTPTVKTSSNSAQAKVYNDRSIYDISKFGPQLTNDYDSIINSVLGSAPSSSGGSGVSSIDLNPMIGAYNQSASSQKDIIKNESTTKRQTLLDTIKRLQEDTIAGKKSQQNVYQQGRSDLEDTAYMTDRGIRASSAAKGLGASGLQSIDAIRAYIESGNKISSLANTNMDKQGELTKNLTRGTEDANKSITQTISEEALKLAGIDADTAQKVVGLQTSEAQRLAEARASAANSASSNASNYASNKNALTTSIKDAQVAAKSLANEFVNQYAAATNKSKKAAAKTEYISQLNSLQGTLGSVLPTNDVKTLTDFIKNYS